MRTQLSPGGRTRDGYATVVSVNSMTNDQLDRYGHVNIRSVVTFVTHGHLARAIGPAAMTVTAKAAVVKASVLAW